MLTITGAIPSLAELQSQLWIIRFLQHMCPVQVPSRESGDAVYKNSLDTYDLDYKLHPACGYDFGSTKHGVDHESYAYQLALDTGGASTISHVYSLGWKVLFTWAMGSNFNPKFRLVGPWKRESDMVEVMEGELFPVVYDSAGWVCKWLRNLNPWGEN